ncbi:MAG: chromosome segregation protein SMC [Christensenellales bacterium]|jgi:chromosome segregation protein|nr:chromosome segregation protein SMC [Eubacteriales bacterium]
MLNLTKIELIGFKSFADKTVLNFTKDITAIVGPNGCGKSNVLDAIRWVLGEQSAKSLRGEKMSDVIFNGTEARKSHSYCEVSLYFDNSAKIFSTDLDEVVFTRKLDRSGSSEYFINRQPCLKRQITDMLYDTGIGKEGYSIIGQNKVDEILSPKNEDRRKIFEEAAGISKFKSQKKEYESNIEKYNLNIERLAGEIALLESRLRPLKSQVEKKKRYDEVASELKWYDINYFIYKYYKNQADKAKHAGRLTEVNAELNALEAENAVATKDYEAAKFIFSETDAEIATVNAELLDLKVSHMEKVGDVNTKIERLRAAEDEERRLNSLILENGEKIAAAKDKIESATLAKEIKMSALKAKSDRLKEVEEEREKLTKILSESEVSYADAASRISGDLERLYEIKANLQQYIKLRDLKRELLEKQRASYEVKSQRLAFERASATSEEAKIQRLSREKAEAAARLTELNRAKAEAEESIAIFSDDYLKLNTQLSASLKSLEFLEQSKRDYNAYQEAVASLMKEKKFNAELSYRIIGTVAELLKVPKEYGEAIDSALGMTLQNIVTPNQEDAKYLINVLKQKQYGTVTFLPMSAIRPFTLDSRYDVALNESGVLGIAADLVAIEEKYKPLLFHLLGNTVVVDNAETAIRLSKKYQSGFKMVTLDGSIFHRGGAMTGGSKRSSGSRILQQEKQILELQKSVETLKKRIEAIEKAKAAAASDLKSAQESLQQTIELINETSTALAASRERLEKAKDIISSLGEEVEAESAEVAALDAEVAKLSAEIESIDALEASALKEKQFKDELSSKTYGELDEVRRKKDLYVTESTMLRVDIAKIESELEQIRSDISRIEFEIGDLETDTAEKREQLLAIKDRIAAISGELNASKPSGEATEKITALEAKLAELTDTKKTFQTAMSDLEEKRGLLSARINELTIAKIKAESAVERITEDMQKSAEYIMEEYGLDYESALSLKSEEFDSVGAENKIKSLKRDITVLGEINHNALADFESVNLEYEQRVRDRDDMVETEASLQKLLADLIKRMTKQFVDTFEIINKNYGEVFRELFAGGKASLHLVLEEGASPLDCDIEIKGNPPGKTVSSLTNLSGGERSMVAISIFFAIMKMKTIPFCVLDEIESALDDTNCRLFAECLRKFCDKSQFIVITHKKPTMEFADQLYGVTMEERGVSKTVSVMLSEALKQASESKKTA